MPGRIPGAISVPPRGERLSLDQAKGYEIWQLSAQVPPEVMHQAQAHGGGCPSSFLVSLFGLDWSSVHGCIIGKIVPGGLADAVGLKVGDSFVSCNGKEISCPSSFEPTIRESFNGPAPGRLVLLIHRPIGGAPSVQAPAPGPPHQ